MMTKRNKHKSKKLLALLFAGCMLSATLGSLAACGTKTTTKDVDDSEVTVTEKDNGRISNAKFEIFDDNDGKNLIITSPTGWSRSAGSSGSGTAPSSNSASGIVDTKNWETYTKTNELPHSTKEEAELNWGKLTTRDKLEFLFNWKKESSDNKVSNLSFYDEDDDIFNYNVDFEDLPGSDVAVENPLKGAGEDDDTAVLMLHNYLSKDNWGTAQKYTSSSTVTLQPGLSAEISVKVKTAALGYANTAGDRQDAVKDRGAYIGLTNSVAGKTLDQVQVKNIISNDEWSTYTFYVTASDYAESTITLVLGLGQGGSNKWEYVSGYAFFDDITCSVKRTEDFSFNSADKIIEVDDDAESKKICADKTALQNNTLHVNLAKTAEYTYSAPFAMFNTDFRQTTEVKNGETFSSGIDGQEVLKNDLTGVYKKSELAAITGNDFLSAVYNKDFANYPFADEKDMLLLFSVSGAPYTAKQTNRMLELGESGEEFSMVALSLWLKTSDLSGGFVGAGIKMHITDTKGTSDPTDDSTTTQDLFLSQNTNSVVKVEIGEGENKNEDAFDGWQQYFVFLKNDSEYAQEISFEFTYGPTALSTTTKDGYREGYAAFANLSAIVLDEDEFAALTEGTYSKVVTIGEEKTAFSKFDDAAGVPSDAIETGFANPANYDGVWGGSKYVAWDGDLLYNEKNSYALAGLLNAEYDYADLITAGVPVTEILAGATQPLVIYNDKAQSYGFIGGTQTIAANSTATIGIKVKASQGAIANVFLMEQSDVGYNEALEITTPNFVYWYDEEGNICAKDPTKSGFDKKRDVAFKRNDRGLFVANTLWSGYVATEMAGKVFANLQNYEVDADGNLLIAKGGVEYNYDASKWEHEGNNGIAFYGYNKDTHTAYLTADKKDVVYDLAALSNVKDFARYAENKQTGVLSMTVNGDEANGEWVECFFYIQTGSEAKSYRLEVWSGNRSGAQEGQSKEKSYVAFELISWSNSFTSLREETVLAAQEQFRTALIEMGKTYHEYALAEGLKEDCDWEEVFRHWYNKEKAPIVYSAFSFFDSAKFLRYDKELDKEEVGNSYDDHNATQYQEGMAYFKFFNDAKNQYSVFVDYSVVDVEVKADTNVEVEEDDHDHDHEDTTATGNGMNIWLLVSSLVLAGVLLLAVVSLIVQKIVRKHRKTHGRKVRAKAPKAKKETPVKAEQPKEEKNEKDPYND